MYVRNARADRRRPSSITTRATLFILDRPFPWKVGKIIALLPGRLHSENPAIKLSQTLWHCATIASFFLIQIVHSKVARNGTTGISCDD